MKSPAINPFNNQLPARLHDERFLLRAIAGCARCDSETTGRKLPVGLVIVRVVLFAHSG